jgi:hypothetical protein
MRKWLSLEFESEESQLGKTRVGKHQAAAQPREVISGNSSWLHHTTSRQSALTAENSNGTDDVRKG